MKLLARDDGTTEMVGIKPRRKARMKDLQCYLARMSVWGQLASG